MTFDAEKDCLFSLLMAYFVLLAVGCTQFKYSKYWAYCKRKTWHVWTCVTGRHRFWVYLGCLSRTYVSPSYPIRACTPYFVQVARGQPGLSFRRMHFKALSFFGVKKRHSNDRDSPLSASMFAVFWTITPQRAWFALKSFFGMHGNWQ